MTRHRVAIAACVRWEHDHVREWLDYHRGNGIDHVYLYCNDDTPDALIGITADLLRGPRPFVTLIHYRLPGLQAQMYLHFIEHHAAETEWFILLDADEFIVSRGHDIPALVQRLDGVSDCIYLHWMIHGFGGRAERPPHGVLASHTRRAASFDHHTKALLRASLTEGLALRLRLELHAAPFWHFWDAFLPPDARITDVLGTSYTGYSTEWLSDRRLAALADTDRAAAMLAEGYIAHFMIKSAADFARRVARGTMGDFRAQAAWRPDGAGFLTAMDAVPDDRLAAWLERQSLVPHHIAPDAGLLPTPLSPAGRFPAVIPAGRNVARGAATTQSSLLYAHLGAARGTDGNCGPADGPCTGHDASAWWEVRFGAPCRITSVVLFGARTLLTPDPGLFELTLFDGDRARPIYRSAHPEEFGGVESAPFLRQLSPGLIADRLRLTRLDPGFLSFAECEVWGMPIARLRGSRTRARGSVQSGEDL